MKAGPDREAGRGSVAINRHRKEKALCLSTPHRPPLNPVCTACWVMRPRSAPSCENIFLSLSRW